MLDYDLRQKLIEVAKRKGTISYFELRPDAPQTLAAPLDEINKYEQGEGRPLLSAVVVHKGGMVCQVLGFSPSRGNSVSTAAERRTRTGNKN